MEIRVIENKTSVIVKQLLTLWEASVRATHLFLSQSEIKNIKSYVPMALDSVEHLVVANDDTNINNIVGFMGINGTKLEMLFLSPESRGKGIGGALLRYGIQYYGVTDVVVNEQNPFACEFYKHMGFKVYKREETDEQGNPYPILYMHINDNV